MGWWWSASDSGKAAKPDPIVETQLAFKQEQQPPSESAHTPEPTELQPQKRALTRDEQSEQELISWLKEIQSETVASQSQPAVQKSKPSAFLEQFSPNEISPDSLYPTEISCRSTFDYAMFCQTFGGQFVNVYRYGSFRSCSSHWDDFWLCMRTRQWEDKDRKKAIHDHYAKRAIKWKTGPSSEDVWEVRTEPAKDAFQGNLEELERQIEEWKTANPDKQAPWSA